MAGTLDEVWTIRLRPLCSSVAWSAIAVLSFACTETQPARSRGAPSDAGRLGVGGSTTTPPATLADARPAPSGQAGASSGCAAGSAVVHVPDASVQTPLPTSSAAPARPVQIARAQSYPSAIVVDATNVFWVNRGFGPADGGIEGAIEKSNLDGSGVTRIAGGQYYSIDIAVDRDNAYWIDFGSSSLTSDGSVMRVSRDGGAIVPLATGLGAPMGIAASGTDVYWTESASGIVARVPSTGGTPVPVASGQKEPLAITVDATSVYWTTGSGNADGFVMKAPLGGGDAVTLASGRGRPAAIAVDATNVYFADGGIWKVPLAGGDPLLLHTPDYPPATSLAVAEGLVYWTDQFSVGKVPVGGGAPAVLSDTENNPSDVAVGPSAIYWTNIGSNASPADGTVSMLAR